MPDKSNLEKHFIESIELPKEDRIKYLEQVITEEPEIGDELKKMIENITKADAFFREIDLSLQSYVDQQSKLSDLNGTTIDSYKLTELIGQGGMATVYKAKRVGGDFEHEVVFKMLSSIIESENARIFFKEEQQILAQLNHPNIARLYNGGVTEDGIPYIVMELVDGVPIDEYCKENKLNLSQKIDLFIKVGQAINYAHQQFILHQDIKPNNILITKSGEVKLLDFGIGKRLYAKLEDQSVPVNKFMGTPAFASPEQLLMQSVNTASDIYQLGVLLYLLIFEELPYDRDVKPSKVVTQILKDNPQNLTTLKSVNGIPKELEAILLKCLKKQVEERYSSVSTLLEDILNFKANKPVNAVPQNKLYLTKKFLQRNSLSTALSSLILISLLGGIFFTSKQAKIALQEKEKAENSLVFIQDLFNSATPLQQQQNAKEIKVFDFLESKKDFVLANEKMSLTDRIDLLRIIHTAYYTLLLREESLELAFLIDSLANQTDDPLYKVYAQVDLGLSYSLLKELKTAIPILENLIPKINLLKFNEAVDVLYYSGRNQYGLRNIESALMYYQKGIKYIKEQKQTPEINEALAKVYSGISHAYRAINNYDSALYYSNAGINAKQEITKDIKDSRNAALFNDNATILMELGELEKADQSFQKAITAALTEFDSASSFMEAILGNYVILQIKQEKYLEAEGLARDILDRSLGKNGNNNNNNNIDVIYAKFQLGHALIPQGKFTEADIILQEALKESINLMDSSNILTGSILLFVTDSKLKQKDFNSALIYSEWGLKVLEKNMPPHHYHVGVAKVRYGRALASKNLIEGKELIEEGLNIIETSEAKKPDYIKEANEYLKELSENKPIL